MRRNEMDDLEAIKRLKARYFRTMDTKDWAGMRELFAADVVVDRRLRAVTCRSREWRPVSVGGRSRSSPCTRRAGED